MGMQVPELAVRTGTAHIEFQIGWPFPSSKGWIWLLFVFFLISVDALEFPATTPLSMFKFSASNP